METWAPILIGLGGYAILWLIVLGSVFLYQNHLWKKND